MLQSAEDHVVLRFPAVLRGMSKVAYCMLEIRRRDSSSGCCTQCRIAGDPPELPDGPYRVEFARYSVQTRKYRGKWEPVFAVPERRTAKAA